MRGRPISDKSCSFIQVYNAGASFGSIAKRHRVSRNSVAGAIRRARLRGEIIRITAVNGMTYKPTVPSLAPVIKVAPVFKPAPAPKPLSSFSLAPAPAPKPLSSFSLAPAIGPNQNGRWVDVFNTTPFCCKFINGSRQWCNAPAKKLKNGMVLSWCDEHYAVVFRAPDATANALGAIGDDANLPYWMRERKSPAPHYVGKPGPKPKPR